MIPILYDKTGNNKLGELNNCIECLVEEERNGIFEVSLVYPINDDICNQLEEENIIACNANDILKNQKFRIYATKKLMTNKVEVYARHISFDLAYDRVESINITNQSCEYALNTIFRQSQFSTSYRGHSDIVNAQDYIISNVNCIEAIAGTKGSIIDTYGTGAEILRDNTDIHVLNKRGHDNEVVIEYTKNLTGFELEEDYSELVTRINAFARYTDTETNESRIIEAKNIDSPLISNYSHPYIASIDYSDRFEQDEVPTSDELIELAKKEFTVNKKDKPKQNFKIEFIPLSKCVGYEELEDKISICDTVTIIDTRYDINTKAKVIRTVFNVLKDRYESMELGEPRTSLGDIIDTGGSGSEMPNNPQVGPQGPPGTDGTDGTNGTDGEDAIYLNLTNDSHIIPTLFDGTGGNYTGCETEIELYKGIDKIVEGVIYEAEKIEGVTSSLTGNVYSISNMTIDSCNVALRATYNDKTYLKYFNVTKSKKGKDGITYYTWIKYANDAQGNGISNDPLGKEYIGFAYNKPTATESDNPKDYTWSLIKGTDGVPGEPGENGETYYTWIRYSDNADGNPCYQQPTVNTQYIGIATNKPTPSESNDPNDYVWSKFRGDDGVDGTDGADGITYYTWIKYANDAQGNGISDNPSGKPYIGFAYNKTTSVESNNPKDYTWSLIKGTDGVPGEPGEDGVTYYTWIKYSDNPNGNPCYETPTQNTRYIGIATNKTTSTESNNPGDYVWSKFRGDDGVPGKPGTNGKDAYTINITNDSHIFEAESNGSISRQQTTSTKVTAFKGVDIASFTIGELPSISGLELSKNGTTVTIKALVGSNLADVGEFEIPIIVDNLEFKKVFSWSKARKGQDGSLGDFPDTLPATPVLTAKVYGFANIELSWTYENKTYYQYELYASKTRNFTPNTFDIIHQGQSSSFLFQAIPNETWFFKVCAINSHGRRSPFSSQVEVTTTKVDNMSNYFEEAAIGRAVVGSLTADYMEAGIIKGNWIDAKTLTVTDGSGKRTLDIDSYGNVNLDVSSLKISSKKVPTLDNVIAKGEAISDINITPGDVKINANKIQLNGATTIGDGINRYVGINNGDYTLYENGKVRGFLGYKKLTEHDSDDIIPRLTLTHHGLDARENSYFTVFPYPANSNPQGTSYPYLDMAYCCPGHQRNDGKGGKIGDYSNIKMFGNGDIKIAPVSKLEITSNYINGEYPADSDGYEKNIATFLSSSSDYYDSCLEIKAVRKWGGSAGLVLGHYNDNDIGTLVRVNTDQNDGKYFRPVTTNAEVQLGSGNYRWHTVFSKNALNASSDRNLKENIKYIEKVPNPKAVTTNEITTKDMYDFVNNELYIARYNFKGDNINKYGFIAQDIVNTKVGSEIITYDRNNSDTLGYDTLSYTNVLAGALKEAIKEIEKLKEDIALLKGDN